jgi:hypothetical protein
MITSKQCVKHGLFPRHSLSIQRGAAYATHRCCKKLTGGDVAGRSVGPACRCGVAIQSRKKAWSRTLTPRQQRNRLRNDSVWVAVRAAHGSDATSTHSKARRASMDRRAWLGSPLAFRPRAPWAINSAHDSRGLCIDRSTINASSLSLSQRKTFEFLPPAPTSQCEQLGTVCSTSPTLSQRPVEIPPPPFAAKFEPRSHVCARVPPAVTARFLLAVRKSAWLVTGSGPPRQGLLTLGLSTALFRCERRRNGQETAQPRRPS